MIKLLNSPTTASLIWKVTKYDANAPAKTNADEQGEKEVDANQKEANWKLKRTVEYRLMWPVKSDPIIYCHFLLSNEQLKIFSKAKETTIEDIDIEIEAFKPEQLLYIGERRALSALQSGIRNYNWLFSLWPKPKSSKTSATNIPEELYILTYYWFLDANIFTSEAELKIIQKENERREKAKQKQDTDANSEEVDPVNAVTLEDLFKDGLPEKVCPMRKTLEARVYLELLLRYIKSDGSLRCNRGMQFDRSLMCNETVKEVSYPIIGDICRFISV